MWCLGGDMVLGMFLWRFRDDRARVEFLSSSGFEVLKS